MKKFILSIILAAANVFASHAQSSVSGSVQDEQGNPLEFATVALFAADSTLVDAATTDSLGVFVLAKSKTGQTLRLSVSLLGYKTYEETLPLSANMGVITLAEDAQSLEAAKVTEKKQLIVQKIDKIVFNVSEAVTAQGTTTDELLKKAPGISIDKDGNVKLNGQPVAVWIDNRPSQLSGKDLLAILKSMESSNVDNIEIMAHPSSKYDAQGSGGIINIKLKKNKVTGFNGSLSANHEGWVYDKQYLQRSGASVSLNYRGKSSNSTFTYSPNVSNELYSMDNISRITNQQTGVLEREVSSVNKIHDFSHRHSVRVVHDQYIGEKDILGFIVSGAYSATNNLSKPQDAQTTMTTPADKTFQHNTIIDNDSRPNIQGDINYTHTFSEEKSSEITVDLTYGYYRSCSFNSLRSPFFTETGVPIDPIVKNPQVFQSTGRQDINIYSAKIDFTHTFAGKYMFEAGAKYGVTRTYNNTLREDLAYEVNEGKLDSTWVKNTGFSTDFVYTEHVAALYANVASSFFENKLSVKLGLRGEYTNSLGDWRSAGTEPTKRSYFNLFPTVYLGYNPKQEHRLSLSYSRRIDRPGYYVLNPQFSYYDAVSGSVGNPYLTPSFQHLLSLSYGFKSWLNLSLMYLHTRDNIMQEPFYDETIGASGFKWMNSGTNNFAGLNLSISELKFTKWWVFNANLFTAYVQSKGETYTTQSVMLFAYGNFTFLLPKDWKIETGVWGSKGFEMNKLKVTPSVDIWAGVKKDLLDGKATLSLFVNDILDSGDVISTPNSDNIYYEVTNKWNSRRLNLSFTYRFGKAHAAKYRRVGQMEESSRLSSGGNGLPTGK